MHSCSDLEDGYMGSGKKIGRSLNKYGIENHTKEILEFLPDRKSLAEREREIVNQEMLNEELCMNLKIGGEGGGGFNTWSVETRKLFNKKGHERRIEVQKTEKYRNTLSESMKLSIKNGILKVPDWTGKSHTEESKQLMRDKAKERIGDKNSQFGTCWITNGIESKKINKGDSIPENWKLGRKIKIFKS